MSSVLTKAEIHALVVYLDDKKLQREFRNYDLGLANPDDRKQPKGKQYKEFKNLLRFKNHPYPVLKFLVNMGLIKICLSDQEKKPHTLLYVPLCKSHLDSDLLKSNNGMMTYDSIISCHDTFELAAQCTGKHGTIGCINLNEMPQVADWQMFQH